MAQGKALRYDAQVNFVWEEGSPYKEINADNFSVRWTGRLKTLAAPGGTGTYTLQTVSDEGVRLWLGGQLLIDNWGAHTETTDSVQVQLQGGAEYDLRVEYYEVSGNATMQLKWLPPGPSLTPPVIIPKGQLLPPTLPPTEPPLDVPQTTDTLVYLHTDHLGSISVTTNVSGQVVSQQRFDPWGKVIYTNGQSPTKLNYTGQRKDDTALLYYHARYYDPALGRFTSPDSIVPGTSLGAGGALGTVGAWQSSKLTVDFHETGFISSANGENQLTLQSGFWFQLGSKDRHRSDPSGPSNPQALNRYSYVLNNPVRYTDPTGHCPVCVVAVPAVPIGVIIGLAVAGVSVFMLAAWLAVPENANSLAAFVEGSWDNLQRNWDEFVEAIKESRPMEATNHVLEDAKRVAQETGRSVEAILKEWMKDAKGAKDTKKIKDIEQAEKYWGNRNKAKRGKNR